MNAQGLDGFGEPNFAGKVLRESAPGIVGHLPEVWEAEARKVAKVAFCANLLRHGGMPLFSRKLSG